MGMVTAVWFLALGLVFGVTIEEGVLGALLMIVLVTLAALAFGTLGAALALRSGSASVVQGTFPLVFVILFLSTAFFPADLLLEPAQTIARYQPAELHRHGGPRPCHLGLLGARAARGARGDPPDRRDRADALLDGAAAQAADRLMDETLGKDTRDDPGAHAALGQRADPRAGRGVPGRAGADDLLPRPHLGLRQPDAAAGVHDRQLRQLHDPGEHAPGRRLHRRGDGRQPRPRHRVRAVRPLSRLPRPALGPADRPGHLGGDPLDHPGDVRLRDRADRRRSLPGPRRAAHRLRRA